MEHESLMMEKYTNWSPAGVFGSTCSDHPEISTHKQLQKYQKKQPLVCNSQSNQIEHEDKSFSGANINSLPSVQDQENHKKKAAEIISHHIYVYIWKKKEHVALEKEKYMRDVLRNYAIIQIQSVLRGHDARRKFYSILAAKKRRDLASNIIYAIVSKYAIKKRKNILIYLAVTKLQAFTRGFLGKAKATAFKKKFHEEILKENERKLAYKVIAEWYIHRKLIKTLKFESERSHEAAIVLQRIIRGHLAKSLYLNYLVKRKVKLAAAISIFHWYKQRKRLQHSNSIDQLKNKAALLIQSQGKVWNINKAFKCYWKQKQSATIIQSFYRRAIELRMHRNTLHCLNLMVNAFNSLYSKSQKFLIYSGFKSLSEHMVRIQGVQDMSAILIQKILRAMISRTKHQKLLRQQKVEQATIFIQRVTRGFFVRLRVGLLRKRLAERFKCSNCGVVEPGGVYCKKCGRRKGGNKKHGHKSELHSLPAVNIPQRLTLLKRHSRTKLRNIGNSLVINNIKIS